MPQCNDCGNDLMALGDPMSGDLQCPHCGRQYKTGFGKLNLDTYERRLMQTGEPGDVAAVLIRLAIKRAGFNPDCDEWSIVRDPDSEASKPVVVLRRFQPPANPPPPWIQSGASSGLKPRCICRTGEAPSAAKNPCGEVYMHSMAPGGEHPVAWCGRCGHTRVCCLTWCAERMEEHAPSAYCDLRKEAQHHRIRKPVRRK